MSVVSVSKVLGLAVLSLSCPLLHAGQRAENPRVGGSTPSQATNLRAFGKNDTAQSTARPALGVSVHSLDPAEVPAYAALGALVVRLDLPWSHVVPQGDSAGGPWAWEPFDRLIGALRASRLTPLLVLHFDHDEGFAGPAHVEAFAAFAAAAAARYPGAILELLNEPNLTPEQTGVPSWHHVEPEAYVSVVAAVRHVAPHATLIGPAIGGGSIDYAYLQRAFAAGLLKYVDAVTLHPYGAGEPESAPAAYARIRRLMGQQERPLVVSEWGFHGNDSDQAELLVRALDANAGAGIGLTVIYSWAERGDGFGLHREDGSLRPAFSAVHDWIRR